MLHANSMVSPCDFCPFVRSSKTNEKDAETERWRQKRGGAAEPQRDRFGHEVARRFGPVATETSRQWSAACGGGHRRKRRHMCETTRRDVRRRASSWRKGCRCLGVPEVERCPFVGPGVSIVACRDGHVVFRPPERTHVTRKICDWKTSAQPCPKKLAL